MQMLVVLSLTRVELMRMIFRVTIRTCGTAPGFSYLPSYFLNTYITFQMVICYGVVSVFCCSSWIFLCGSFVALSLGSALIPWETHSTFGFLFIVFFHGVYPSWLDSSTYSCGDGFILFFNLIIFSQNSFL
ncbi:unnamed protein product [Prunus armeniaca]